MLYLKNNRSIKPNRKRVAITSFQGINCTYTESLLPLKYSPLSHNYRFGNGALMTGMGLNKAKLPVLYNNTDYHLAPEAPHSIQGIWLYRRYDHNLNMRDDRIVVFCSNGKFYQSKLFAIDNYSEIGNVTISGKVNTTSYRLNGKDVLLISSEHGKLWVYDGDNPPYMVNNSPNITSMCIHYERLYATTGGEKNEVWFSDDFDPTNWNVTMIEGGFIQFNDDLGRANKVISFLDHIYIFRDYGINRLTAYGEQSDFNMSRLFVSSGRIYPETIAVCGNRVLFLAEDGIYMFDGVSVRRILDEVTPLITCKDFSLGCYHSGKYYLAATALIQDTNRILSEREVNWRNNILIEVDLNKSIVNL